MLNLVDNVLKQYGNLDYNLDSLAKDFILYSLIDNSSSLHNNDEEFVKKMCRYDRFIIYTT